MLGVLEHGDCNGEEFCGIRQPSHSGVGSGESSDIGSYHDSAASPESAHIGLSGGMQPHLGMHGGREDDRAVRGQQHIGQQIIGLPGGGPREQISGGRRNEDQIDLLSDLDMRHKMHVVEHRGAHGPTGQCGPGAYAHKFQGRSSGHHSHLVASTLQAT